MIFQKVCSNLTKYQMINIFVFIVFVYVFLYVVFLDSFFCFIDMSILSRPLCAALARWVGIVLQTEKSPVWVPVRACAWVMGFCALPCQALTEGRRQSIDVSLSHQYFFPSHSPSLSTINFLKNFKEKKATLCLMYGFLLFYYLVGQESPHYKFFF